jgi:formyltetrahydrofolate deformylase
MEADFQHLALHLGATRSLLRVPAVDDRRRMGILVSQFDHCLTELLHRWEGGELDVDLTCVVRRVACGSQCTVSGTYARDALRSNHPRERNTYVSRFLERHGVPLYYIPAGGPAPQGQMRSHEPAILSLVHRSDFLVTARYMQILSGGFLNAYGRDIINIHHGLLPSFKGACPAAYCVSPEALTHHAHIVSRLSCRRQPVPAGV